MRTKLIVVMGVSGCGKSTIASLLAEKLDYRFIEADDFHSIDNKAHMASGKPLDDSMREPWIESLTNHLKVASQKNQHSVMSFSGLRAVHRARIRAVPMTVTFIFLSGDKSLISQRMAKRTGHFMPSSLLASQYATLEEPSNESNTYRISIDQPIDSIVNQAQYIVELNHAPRTLWAHKFIHSTANTRASNKTR